MRDFMGSIRENDYICMWISKCHPEKRFKTIFFVCVDASQLQDSKIDNEHAG